MVERIISNNDQEKPQSHSLVLAFNVTQRAALVCLCRNLFWQTILADDFGKEEITANRMRVRFHQNCEIPSVDLRFPKLYVGRLTSP